MHTLAVNSNLQTSYLWAALWVSQGMRGCMGLVMPTVRRYVRRYRSLSLSNQGCPVYMCSLAGTMVSVSHVFVCGVCACVCTACTCICTVLCTVCTCICTVLVQYVHAYVCTVLCTVCTCICTIFCTVCTCICTVLVQYVHAYVQYYVQYVHAYVQYYGTIFAVLTFYCALLL